MKDFLTFIYGTGNDFKLAIDDLIDEIVSLRKDVEELKRERKKEELSIIPPF